ncbi:MAG: SMI1/KNR4 family protein [Propioniciclava sp.]
MPPSYLWFVDNYGGGEVYGEEIFSIYSTFRPESVGDLAVSTCRFREEGLTSPTEIAIWSTDFGEIFTLEALHVLNDAEYRVYVQRGPHREEYAENFADFLTKCIENPEG